jgi:hypothetical protein
MGAVKDTNTLDLGAELENSRVEIVKLAERVHRLVAKRNEREALVQRLRRSVQCPGSLAKSSEENRPLHLCGLCATDHAAAAIEHVRACAANSKCDHCGQPAVMWIQLKKDEPSRLELAGHR